MGGKFFFFFFYGIKWGGKVKVTLQEDEYGESSFRFLDEPEKSKGFN